MDLTGVTLRAAAARPHVLVVTTPGGTAVRLAAERELRLRDWPSVATPAQADLLFVAGAACPDLDAALGRLWRDLPAPRARTYARTAEEVTAALDAAGAQLASPQGAGPPGGHSGSHSAQGGEPSGVEAGGQAEHERHPMGGRHGDDSHDDSPDPAHGGPEGGQNGHRHQPAGHDGNGGHGDHAGRGSHGGHGDEADRGDSSASGGERAPESHDGHGGHSGDDSHGGHGDHGGHGGHHGMDMATPYGLPMPRRGEDRDGLTLDQLRVSLGPFLADWPDGLSVRLLLNGDVIQQAAVDAPPAHTEPVEVFWAQPWVRAAVGEAVTTGEAARRRAAAHLDSLGRLLAVAGWPSRAVTARRLRDDLLDGAPAAALAPRLERFTRRVGRSWTLYWLTRGMGPLTAEEAEAAGVSGPAARAGGDVPARYRQWLSDIRRDVERLADHSRLDPEAQEGPRGRWDAERPPSAALRAVLPRLLTGAELATARIVVASLDPDPDELAACRREVTERG